MELFGQTSGTRRKRGRRQRGGFTWVYTQGGTRRKRGCSQRGGMRGPYDPVEPNAGGTRRNRGRRQRGGITITRNGDLG